MCRLPYREGSLSPVTDSPTSPTPVLASVCLYSLGHLPTANDDWWNMSYKLFPTLEFIILDNAVVSAISDLANAINSSSFGMFEYTPRFLLSLLTTVNRFLEFNI